MSGEPSESAKKAMTDEQFLDWAESVLAEGKIGARDLARLRRIFDRDLFFPLFAAALEKRENR